MPNCKQTALDDQKLISYNISKNWGVIFPFKEIITILNQSMLKIASNG